MNAWLQARGGELLADTGTHQRGETEFVSIKGGTENPWYLTPHFKVVRPDGTEGDWYPKVPRTGGEKRATCVVPVVIHNGVALIGFLRQDRPVLRTEAWYGQGRSAWVNEQPRAFAVSANVTTIAERAVTAADPAVQAPLAVLGREIPALLDGSRVIMESVVFLASEPEDTGMSCTVVDYWLVQFRATPDFNPAEHLGPPLARIRFYPLQAVNSTRKRQALDVHGNHTLVALKMYEEYLRGEDD